ncbi:MAG: hypothetical protein WC521_02320 [Bdellovibrionales bacterium]
MEKNGSLLTIPPHAAENILKGNGIVVCPLLKTDEFVKFCKERNVTINKERLWRLEHLRLFFPIFRVRTPDKENASKLKLPLEKIDEWFPNRWAWNTVKGSQDIPELMDIESEAYYSVFQIFCLEAILPLLTFSLSLDAYLDQAGEIDWQKNAKSWMTYAHKIQKELSENEFRQSVVLLCQYISDRYYPHTQGDQRTISISLGTIRSDQWIEQYAPNWKWQEYSKKWNLQETRKFFQLTPEKLKHAYTALSVSQAHIDPLERWYQLVQFVNIDERKRLKGDALHSETLRSGAFMLRMLYKDLYGEELLPPNEIVGQVITHVPEQSVRKDSRRYLEFVSNRYHLNPQPKLVLFVEGKSEEVAIRTIFEKYVGAHPGKFSIEIVCLGGVETATGAKKEDRFRAILRLIDYLHHHQTFTFLILDNEGYARRLKDEARKAKSIHHQKRYITRPEYIKIWKTSFEFDNYSNSEIASAMSSVSKTSEKFSAAEIKSCKTNKFPGSALSTLYEQKTGHDLNKIKFNEALVEAALSKETKKHIENRPIMKALERIEKLAIRNPLPTMQEVWEKNQSSHYLGKKRKRVFKLQSVR